MAKVKLRICRILRPYCLSLAPVSCHLAPGCQDGDAAARNRSAVAQSSLRGLTRGLTGWVVDAAPSGLKNYLPQVKELVESFPTRCDITGGYRDRAAYFAGLTTRRARIAMV